MVRKTTVAAGYQLLNNGEAATTRQIYRYFDASRARVTEADWSYLVCDRPQPPRLENSCNSCKQLIPSRLHELHESKLPFVSCIEFIRPKLSTFSVHVSGVSVAAGSRRLWQPAVFVDSRSLLYRPTLERPKPEIELMSGLWPSQWKYGGLSAGRLALLYVYDSNFLQRLMVSDNKNSELEQYYVW